MPYPATLDYLRQWSVDLNVKGFQSVKVVDAPIPHIVAQRKDGKRFFGYAAMEPSELNEPLHLQLRGKLNGDSVVFLVVSCELMSEAERRLKKWELHSKVNLEGIF